MSHAGRCAEGWQVYVHVCERLYPYVHLVMPVSVYLCVYVPVQI